MSEKIDKIIKKLFIPAWIESTKDLLFEAVKENDIHKIAEYLNRFEHECAYFRSQTAIKEINKN